jgi:uncharacterized protein YbbK (DUF523 family)
VELIPICPEVEIGLGVPREPIRLVRGGGAGPRPGPTREARGGGAALVQPATGRDVTEPMHAFSTRFLEGLPEVEGFVLKARSPSCGIHGVKLFGDAVSEQPRGRGTGMFAAAVLAAYPDHPIEREARLDNLRLLDEFLTRIFALADLREARARDASVSALATVHRRYQAMLEACAGPGPTRALGELAGGTGRRAPAEAWDRYQREFRRLLARTPRPRGRLLIDPYPNGLAEPEGG